MIIKKIESGPIDSKAAYVMRLTNYILKPDSKGQEKVLYCAAIGFLSNDLQAAKLEMAALADGAKRSSNPTLHLIISWKEGEQPSNEQVDDAVCILMTELGLDGHGAIYALHQDTDNLHCHVEISRVNCETEKVVVPARGFDIEAIHRAIARIEHVQGWEREANSRYEILDDGKLVRSRGRASGPRMPGQRQRDAEHRTGAKSLQGIAIEKASALIANATTWDGLHQRLSTLGMRYERVGSGAVLYLGDAPIKASSVHRNASLKRMEQRLGPYRQFNHAKLNSEQERGKDTGSAFAVNPDSKYWHTYIAERQSFYQNKDKARRQLHKAQDDARKALFVLMRAERKELLGGGWAHKGIARQAIRSLLAAQHAAKKAELNARLKAQRCANSSHDGAFPDYAEWLTANGHGEEAEDWRYRQSSWPRLTSSVKSCEVEVEPTARDIRSFEACLVGNSVHYMRTRIAGQSHGVAFVDRGSHIDVCNHEIDDDAVLAAMQLAETRWGAFEIEGSDEFRHRCILIAAKNGMKLENPVLGVEVDIVRKRLNPEIGQDASQPCSIELSQYFEAVKAPKYCIYFTEVMAGNIQKTQRMGSGTAHRSGLNELEIWHEFAKMRLLHANRLPRMTFSIEPQFPEHVAIRVKNVSLKKLAEIQDNGFIPRAVLEVAPNEFELLLTIPAGLTHAAEATKSLSRILHFQFGVTVELCSNTSAGHTMPGHPIGSKTSEFVKVHSSTDQNCQKAEELLWVIDRAIQAKSQQSPLVTEHGDELQQQDALRGSASASIEYAYQTQHKEVCAQFQGVRIDNSRVDAQIALRLKIAGHSRHDVEAAMAVCCPRYAKSNAKRDWLLYARRAAGFAWGPAGKRHEEMINAKLQKQLGTEIKNGRFGDRPKPRHI